MLRWTIPFLLIICADNVTSKKDARNITGFNIIEGLCMSSRSDRLVYRYRNDSYVYVAFDTVTTGKVDIYSWEIITSRNGTYISFDMKEENEYAIDFRKNVNRDHVIGATNKRYHKKFKTRMRRKMEHCRELRKKKKYCKLSAIQSVFARIDMREVHYMKNSLGDCDTFIDKPKDEKRKKRRKGRKESNNND